MIDTYSNFQELKEKETEGTDFRIEFKKRNSPYLIAAIHGGEIEKDTTEIAEAIAGEEHSFYSFIGEKFAQHITSAKFDEPTLYEMLSECEKVVSIHGMNGGYEFVEIGGLDSDLMEEARIALSKAGFDLRVPTESMNGNSPENFCNRCLSRKGLQLELSQGLREHLKDDPVRLNEFVKAVQSVLTPANASI